VTREKAKKLYDEDPQEDCMGLIDAIYNEFESRVCENCNHWNKNGKQCLNEQSIAYTSEEAIDYDDGCNKFKRKDNQIGT